jgi:hypothetical protein
MRKCFLPVLLLLLAYLPGFTQSLPTPEQFLGYRLGTHFTPHYRVLEYFKAVAAVTPNMKLQQYGTTYEGRPLMMAIIASPENFGRLQAIQEQNLQLANGKGNSNSDYPVIVWLSYNVHGNEAVSTEAAMRTLYLLADKNHAQTQQWLKNTVVIIDPCLNPDGRERYVSFYNQVQSLPPNPVRYSWEHNEPWPGGRANHYYFDLNRDWAWQTQKESQERLIVYNQWMPQVHVDFHEQGIDEPYYFAPAAEPFHEVIKPWQRDMQTLIGKNNAKYFDEKGWLYFTKERFDLFYPSYGDTYPTYNGAIGMTYEQGGSGAAGLAVLKQDNDTLTLTDRIDHHVTTGLSTIEVASQQAKKITGEFSSYFRNATAAPDGPYKTYVIKAAGNVEKLASLAALLRKNNIAFGYGAGASKASGFNYFSGKTENFDIDREDMVISAFQPRSNLLQVLFEPQSRLSDSVTYDITAWAIPYAYGLPAYALPQSLRPQSDSAPAVVTAATDVSRPYAYLASWNSTKDVRFLTALLQQNIKVRYAEAPFTIGGRTFPPGTLIIPRAGNEQIGSRFDTYIRSLANDVKVTLDAVATGFVEKGTDFGSDKVRYIQPLQVAMLVGDGISSLGVGEIWHFFEQQIGYPITLINVRNLKQVSWKDINVLILPDGNYDCLNDKTTASRLKDWVSSGGRLIALQGALAQLAAGDWGIHLKKGKEEENKDNKDNDKDLYSAVKPYANRERESVRQFIPGAIYKVQLDSTHPLAFGYTDRYYTLKQDDNIYEFLEDDGWNVGILKKDNYLSGFVGVETRARLKDGLLFGVKDIGNGKLVMLADDPLFRSFWENGKLLFSNAVFLVF